LAFILSHIPPTSQINLEVYYRLVYIHRCSREPFEYDCIFVWSGLKETLSQEDWLISVLPENSRVGVDPWIIAAGEDSTIIPLNINIIMHTNIFIHFSRGIMLLFLLGEHYLGTNI